MRLFEPKWMKPVHDVHKHLEENEKWLQFPEEKRQAFEREMTLWHDQWHPSFRKKINDLENMKKQLERELDE